MADGKQKKRGRYKEYLRYSNPYKFPAARRKGNVKRYLKNTTVSPTISRENYGHDLDFEFEREEDVFIPCDQPSRDLCINDSSCEADMTSASLPSDNDKELEDIDCSTSDNELSESLSMNMFSRFIKDDDDNSSEVFSDNENIVSDSEPCLEDCGTDDNDDLYSGAPITTTSSVVLILSFVFKHNLTREAFRDLLTIIEAHCLKPNNCKTNVKKVFDFVSQTKGSIVKHFFCSYCKAYCGQGSLDRHGNAEIKGICHICGKNLANTNGFYIEVPIVKQLQTFFSGKCIQFFVK